jgi:hypothetical protein
MKKALENQRPAKVTAASVMMYVVVAIGIVRAGMTVVRHLEVRSPDLFIMTKLLTYLVSAFLIYKMSKGANWARWSLTAVLLIAIPLSVLPAFDAIQHSPVHTLLGFVQLGLYVLAVVFLFQRDSSLWFSQGSGDRVDAEVP